MIPVYILFLRTLTTDTTDLLSGRPKEELYFLDARVHKIKMVERKFSGCIWPFKNLLPSLRKQNLPVPKLGE